MDDQSLYHFVDHWRLHFWAVGAVDTFGVWWSGVPFGYDWTDNKVLVELIFWLIAAYMNRDNLRNRSSVYLAGFVTLLVYFIPHSIFGSEYDYRTGTGHGTAG
ncbi:MAG: hypothetical protein Kow002_11750 [Anaerolineales bacterium]